jgi:hypothetical protein
MQTVVGPILIKKGCYAFDLWTPEEGLSRGYPYRRVEDAHYARNAEIKSRRRQTDPTVVCATLEEFTTAVAEREATYRALVSRLKPQSAGAAEHTLHALIKAGVVAATAQ